MVTCTDRGDLCFWPPDEDKVSTIDSGHHDHTEPVTVMFVRDFLVSVSRDILPFLYVLTQATGGRDAPYGSVSLDI